MFLELPNYNMSLKNGAAEINEGNLYLHRLLDFDSIMVELAYIMYGKDCYYCKRKFSTDSEELKDTKKYFSKLTIDHLIPKEFGGPTITNNLRPTCVDCNNTKGNLLPYEFQYLQDKKREEGVKEIKREIKQYKESLSDSQERRRFGELEVFPEGWLTECPNNLLVNLSILNPLGLSYRKIQNFYKKYRRINKVVVFSKNGVLLDGLNGYLFAKYEGTDRIHFIMLENVIYDGLII